MMRGRGLARRLDVHLLAGFEEHFSFLFRSETVSVARKQHCAAKRDEKQKNKTAHGRESSRGFLRNQAASE